MNKTVSITNDGDSPRYVMGRMIPPGETVVLAEDEAPPEYLAPAEEAAPAVAEDPLLAVSELSIGKMELGLPDLSDDDLTRLEALEKAKEKPRAGALAVIVAERLRRAEAAAPGGMTEPPPVVAPETPPVAVDGEKGQ